MKIVLTSLALIASYLQPIAQIKYSWRTAYNQYTKQHGILTNIVYCISQDKQGFIWLGTDAGLIRFDGKNTIQYNVKNGLPCDDIYQIFCDSKNRIWISTFKNDICYIKNNKVYNTFNDSSLSPCRGKSVYPRYLEDDQGNIWIITLQENQYKIDKDNKLTSFHLDPPLSGMFQYDNYVYFLGDKLYKINIKNNKQTLLNKNLIKSNKLKSSVIHSIKKSVYLISEDSLVKCSIEDIEKGKYVINGITRVMHQKDSLLYIATNKGIEVFNANNLTKTEVLLEEYLTSGLSIKNNFFGSTIGDGFFKIYPNNIKCFYGNTTRNSEYFSSICIHKNYLYTGTHNETIYIFKWPSLEFQRVLNLPSDFKNNRILKILPFNNEILILTDNKIYTLLGQEKIQEKYNYDKRGALKNIYIQNDTLITLKLGGMIGYRYGREKPIFELSKYKRIYAYVLHQNKHLFATEDTVYTANLSDSSIEKVFDQHRTYWAVDFISKGDTLYTATSDKGVLIETNDKSIILNESNGLTSNNCRKILLHKNSLYITTNKGINIFSLDHFTYSYVLEMDGIPSNNVTDLTIHNETLYISTEDGLCQFPIKNVRKERKFKINVTQILIDSIYSNIGSKIHKAKTNDNIEITVNNFDYNNQQKFTYHYRINNDSKTHSTTDNQIKFRLNKPGKYFISIYALDDNLNKSNTETVEINIIPYWYQHNAFMFIIILIAFGLLLYLIKYIIQRTKLKEFKKFELEKMIHHVELSKWKSTISPHFIFNSLNTLQSINQKSDFYTANRYITQFSNILRRSIDFSDKLFISIIEEVNFIENYLELEKLKKVNSFNYSIQIDDSVREEYQIPSLILQPLVENAIKHGIKDIHGGEIRIVISSDKEHLSINIIDNGEGINKETTINSSSKGIALVQKKLSIIEKFIKKPINFRVDNYTKNNQISGTICIITIPIILKETINDYNTHS